MKIVASLQFVFSILAIGLLLLMAGVACSPSKTTSALISAVKQGDLEAVKKMTTTQNVNGTDESGATPLMWAAYSGKLEIVRYLADKGGDCKGEGTIIARGKDKQV